MRKWLRFPLLCANACLVCVFIEFVKVRKQNKKFGRENLSRSQYVLLLTPSLESVRGENFFHFAPPERKAKRRYLCVWIPSNSLFIFRRCQYASRRIYMWMELNKCWNEFPFSPLAHTHTNFPRQDKFNLISSRGQRVLSIFFLAHTLPLSMPPTRFSSQCVDTFRLNNFFLSFLSFKLSPANIISWHREEQQQKKTEKEIVVFRRAVFLTAVARDSKWKHLLWKIYGRSLRIMCSKRRVSQRLYVKDPGEHSSRAGENLQKFVVKNLSWGCWSGWDEDENTHCAHYTHWSSLVRFILMKKSFSPTLATFSLMNHMFHSDWNR